MVDRPTQSGSGLTVSRADGRFEFSSRSERNELYTQRRVRTQNRKRTMTYRRSYISDGMDEATASKNATENTHAEQKMGKKDISQYNVRCVEYGEIINRNGRATSRGKWTATGRKQATEISHAQNGHAGQTSRLVTITGTHYSCQYISEPSAYCRIRGRAAMHGITESDYRRINDVRRWRHSEKQRRSRELYKSSQDSNQ